MKELGRALGVSPGSASMVAGGEGRGVSSRKLNYCGNKRREQTYARPSKWVWRITTQSLSGLSLRPRLTASAKTNLGENYGN